MKKTCITGANGFIGKSIYETLSKKNKLVVAAVRTNKSFLSIPNTNFISIDNIDRNTNWSKALEDCDNVIHCAGKAHVMDNENKFDDYHSINVEGTKNLAEQAAKAGVKRLIFLSSIKVNGESTDKVQNKKIEQSEISSIFTHINTPNPKDPYAISKYEAEKELWKISDNTGLEITIVRLPLVYGYGVKGNLRRLIKLVKFGIPLPFKRIQNCRSMIGIDNLVDFLTSCIEHPNAAGKTFLVSDGEDLSTPDLVNRIATSMGFFPLLFPVPIQLLKFIGLIMGKKKEINRLVGSLKIDNSYSREVLNWKPPLSVAEGIRRMVHGK
tara:strand:+ start:2312 stop:3286 length:975 start_codon:yes stop_codon:yes gene_type:complete